MLQTPSNQLPNTSPELQAILDAAFEEFNKLEVACAEVNSYLNQHVIRIAQDLVDASQNINIIVNEINNSLNNDSHSLIYT